jgi:hypothetical protein
MKQARRKRTVQAKEPLVAAAQTIGSTLGVVVAKIRAAGGSRVAKRRTTAKRRQNRSSKQRAKSKKQ